MHAVLQIMDSASLPIIDFSNHDRQDTAMKLAEAMETVGYVYLDNVEGYNKEVEAELLQAAKWFYSMPLEEKLRYSPKKWNKDAKGVYRGYIPLPPDTTEHRLVERFIMGEILPDDDPERRSGNPLYEPTPMPFSEFTFCEVMKSHYSCMLNAGMEFLKLTAIGLGLDENIFNNKFIPKSVSTLQLMHYPTYVKKEGESLLTCGEHQDKLFVTFLTTFGPGLEYQREDGLWVGIEPRPGSLIANIGIILSQLTDGRFKAVRHRVRDIQKDRYSIPFVLEARSDAKFDIPNSTGSITYGPWLVKQLRKSTYAFRHLPDVS